MRTSAIGRGRRWKFRRWSFPTALACWGRPRGPVNCWRATGAGKENPYDHFIGAGPGAADLITVRGARLLGEADVIIYAGSLVNPALLEYRKEGCQVYDSASMTLEEVLAVMRETEAARRQDHRPAPHRGPLPLRGHPGSRWTPWMWMGSPTM